jgi:lipoprotein-anchoring transpeptidase ErfK/SrfK
MKFYIYLLIILLIILLSFTGCAFGKTNPVDYNNTGKIIANDNVANQNDINNRNSSRDNTANLNSAQNQGTESSAGENKDAGQQTSTSNNESINKTDITDPGKIDENNNTYDEDNQSIDKNSVNENQAKPETINSKPPTLKLVIMEGPDYAQDGSICFYRVKATVSGSPEPQIIFNKDDSNGAWGKNISQINLTEDQSFTLSCNAENSAGKTKDSIILSWVPGKAEQAGNAVAVDFTDIGNLKIDVDLANQLVTVYYKEGIVKQMVCSSGNDQGPTPLGNFAINQKIYYAWVPKFNEGAYYWTRFYGPYLFHSVPFDSSGKMLTEELNKIGTPASHGCIRLKIEEAKWLYETIPLGVSVVIHK